MSKKKGRSGKNELINIANNGIIERIKHSSCVIGYSLTYIFKDTLTGLITPKEIFRPVYQTAASTSKYMPHQGARECERRRVGGFHFVRRMEKLNNE